MEAERLENLIKESKKILILTGEEPRAEDLETALALFYILRKRGKNVNLLSPKFRTSVNCQLDSFNKEFAISINGENKEITEMRYEKEESRLKVYLNLKRGEIQKEDIIIERPKELSSENEEDCQSELLIIPTPRNFSNEKNLLTENSSKVKLLSQVLNKLELDQKAGFYFASLAREDFLFSGTSPKDLSFVIEELKSNFKISSLLLLWENYAPKGLIRGVFYSSQSDSVKKILKNFEGSSKGKGVLFSIKDSNDLKEAKEKVLETFLRK